MSRVTTMRAAMPEKTATTPLISEPVSSILAGRAGAKHVGNYVCFS